MDSSVALLLIPVLPGAVVMMVAAAQEGGAIRASFPAVVRRALWPLVVPVLLLVGAVTLAHDLLDKGIIVLACLALLLVLQAALTYWFIAASPEIRLFLTGLGLAELGLSCAAALVFAMATTTI